MPATNRSMPDASIIPVLHYPDVAQAVEWLAQAFGFTPRLRVGHHRVQLAFGNGAMVAAEGESADGSAFAMHSMMVRVDDADAHHARAVAAGARIMSAPESHPYGERQYTALDLAGHAWTFSQSERDVHPAEWGGELV